MKTAPQRKMMPSGVDWIGDVPEGWNVTRFGYHATVKANLVEVDDYGSFPQISPENIEKNTGRLLAHGTVEDSGVISGNHLFKQGQILYSKIRPALNKVTIAPYPGLCCADMYPIETDEDTRFMVYLMLADCFVKQTETVANMRIKMPKINQGELSRIRIALPPLDEQKRIAAKLDRLCGRVDELAENIKGEIAALQEYRKSLITECVTKGLNPKAKMKPSGVDWIGKVPTEWNVEKVKYHYSVITGNGFPVELQGVEDGDYPVCKASDISTKGKFVESTKNWITKDIAELLGFNVIPRGSVIFPKIGEAMKKNSRKIVAVDCCVDNNCQGVFSPDMDEGYSYYAFTCIDMKLFDNHGPIPCLNNQKLKDYLMPIPPANEQREIAAFLDKRCAVIDAKIAERQKQLEKLGEYRSSVIYEYVTGKREVLA